jgi:hypothetical protein
MTRLCGYRDCPVRVPLPRRWCAVHVLVMRHMAEVFR